VKLTDFGIAKAATKASTTERGALRGKLMYMSPEQAWGRPIDHRSDLFSLGARPVRDAQRREAVPWGGRLGHGGPQEGAGGRRADALLARGRDPGAAREGRDGRAVREPEGRPRNAGILQQELEGLLKAETPATARELGSFLRRLFDVPDEDTQEHRVEAEPSVEPPRGEGVPSLLAPLSVEQLLARFDHE